MRCTPQSIFRSIAKAAFYGWVCDGLLGQGYLVPFGNEATLIAGYKGLRDLVRRSGQADTMMEAVYEGDEFAFNGPFALPTHTPSRDRDRLRKPILGAYCVIYFTQTRHYKAFYWPIEQVLAHRDRYSKSWARDQSEKNLWHEKNAAFPVMCAKTVLRAVINRGEAPVSLEDRSLTSDPDAPDADAIGAIDVSAAIPDAASVPAIENHAPDSEDPIAAEDRQVASDATEREYLGELLPGLKLETEIRGLIADAAKHAELTPAAQQRIKDAAEKRIAAIKGGRGERSNKQKSMVGE